MQGESRAGGAYPARTGDGKTSVIGIANEGLRARHLLHDRRPVEPLHPGRTAMLSC